MSRAKQYMESSNAKRGAALRIALDAHVLDQCEIHEYVIEGSCYIEDAYNLGEARFAAGELKGTFRNKRKMRDAIEKIVDEYQWTKCAACVNNAAEQFRPLRAVHADDAESIGNDFALHAVHDEACN